MDKQEKETECLRELGFSEKLVQRYAASMCMPEKLSILMNFRAGLLAKLHTDQRRLECIDFMIYELRRGD